MNWFPNTNSVEAQLAAPTRESVRWVACSDGNVPSEAVRNGITSSGERCYFGRAYVESEKDYVEGQVIPSRGRLVVLVNGQELTFTEYEVMVMNVGGMGIYQRIIGSILQ